MVKYSAGKKEIRECKMCGKEFLSLLTAERSQNKKKPYCSANCFHTAQRLGLSAHKKVNMVSYSCKNCGEKFDAPSWDKRTYCSNECYIKGRYKNIQPKSNTYRSQRDRLKAHSRPPCRICGFKRYVELCHVIPRQKNGEDTEENRIYLCPNHHKLFDTHRLNKTELKKLDDKLLLIYNSGIPQTKTFHLIHPRSDFGTGGPSSS